MTPNVLRLIVRPPATRAIADQARYYRLRATTELAARWRAAAAQAIRSLRTLPERGSLIDLEEETAQTIRRLPIEGFPRHLIFYCLDSEAAAVIVLLVSHGSRDMDPLLREESEE
jgi:plasmid stabilization system protein ParE